MLTFFAYSFLLVHLSECLTLIQFFLFFLFFTLKLLVHKKVNYWLVVLCACVQFWDKLGHYQFIQCIVNTISSYSVLSTLSVHTVYCRHYQFNFLMLWAVHGRWKWQVKILGMFTVSLSLKETVHFLFIVCPDVYVSAKVCSVGRHSS